MYGHVELPGTMSGRFDWMALMTRNVTRNVRRTMTIAILVASTVVSFVLGTVMGVLPMRQNDMTDRQVRFQQVGGIIAVGLILVLMAARQDAASWAAIGAMILGVVVGRIPLVNKAILTRFLDLRPRRTDGAKAHGANHGAKGSKRP